VYPNALRNDRRSVCPTPSFVCFAAQWGTALFLLSQGYWKTLFAKGFGTIDYQFEKLWTKREGTLSEKRFEGYQKLQRELSYTGLNARQLENEKINRMFGGKDEMKRMKKHVKERNNR